MNTLFERRVEIFLSKYYVYDKNTKLMDNSTRISETTRKFVRWKRYIYICMRCMYDIFMYAT